MKVLDFMKNMAFRRICRILLIYIVIFLNISDGQKCAVPMLCGKNKTPSWGQITIQTQQSNDSEEELKKLDNQATNLFNDLETIRGKMTKLEEKPLIDATSNPIDVHISTTPTDSLAASTAFEYNECQMGMKSGKIPDSAITSSSRHDKWHSAELERLDNTTGVGAWSTGKNKTGEWIQVDLGEAKQIFGIITQGRRTYHGQWVTSYKASCSTNNGFPFIMENGTEKIFPANSDRNTSVYNRFAEPKTCRYFRLYPQTWHKWMSLRLELLGECP